MDERITARPGTRVHAAEVMDQLHSRYGRQLAQLIQENAELAAALDTTRRELDEASVKIAAITDVPPPTTAAASIEQDHG